MCQCARNRNHLGSCAIYSNARGVQVLAKLSGHKLIPVADHDLFIDGGRNAHAFKGAIGPLLGESKTEAPVPAPAE